MSVKLIRELSTSLAQLDQAYVVRALRQEPLLWHSLEDEAFLAQALSHTSSQPQYWSPASLSLLALGAPDSFLQLKDNPEAAVDNNLRTQALSAYDTRLNLAPSGSHPLTLPQAGLLALALRERWRLNGSWQELVDATSTAPLTVWKPVFACLVGMLANPRDLLEHLVIASGRQGLDELAVHAFLSNPLSQAALADIFISVLSQTDLETALPVLRLLGQQFPDLGKEVSAALAAKLDAQDVKSPSDLEDLQSLMNRSEVYQFSGQYSKAMPLLDAAWQHSRKLQTDMAARLAQSAADDHDELTAQQALARANEIDPDPQQPLPALSLAQLHTGQLDPRYLQRLEEPGAAEASHPASHTAVAKLAQQSGDLPRAQDFARRALESALHTENIKQVQEKTLQSLTELFIEVDLPQEALQAAKLALAHNPNHAKTLMNMSKAQLSCGEGEAAQDSAQIAVTLSPNDLALQRNLGKVLTANSEWAHALRAWEKIVSQQSVPNAEDLYEVAECAIAADQPEKAVQASQQVLNTQVQDGRAHALIGQAYHKLGDTANALQHFNQAIDLAPELPQPWLALANYHLVKGERDAAREKLVTAAEAIPLDPQIRLALAETYLAEENPSQGLAEVQQAHLFMDDRYDLLPQADLLAGKALLALGRTYDACQKLAAAHHSYPNNLNIAHQYGRALLQSEDAEQALEVLSEVKDHADAPLESLLDYADAHINLGEQPQEARKAVETVLQQDPAHPEALALLAETLSLEGQHEKALEKYKQTMNTDLIQKEGWQARMSAGMAKSALALNQPQAAIAALEEVLGQMPDDLGVMKTLCQAYVEAGLQENAAGTLSAVHKLGQDDVLTMLWVADHAIKLGQSKLANQALTRAMELQPEHANVLVRMGYLQMHQQDPDAARQTFSKLFSAKMLHTSELRLAAQALSELGDVSASVPYLKKALELGEEDQSTLLADLTKVQLQAGDYLDALDSIEKQIEISPEEPALLKSKADVLIALKRAGEALACLRQALELDPGNHRLLYEIAQLQRENHELAAALVNIEKALSLAPDDKLTRYLAAEINHASLHTKRVRKLLNQVEPQREPTNPSWALRKSEYLLEAGEMEKAAELLTGVEEVLKDHPRLLANQARIHARHGSLERANALYKQALTNLSKVNPAALKAENRANIHLSLAEAAMELHAWDDAIKLTGQAIDDQPAEPQPRLMLAKALVRRAEFQQLCQDVQAVNHAPGDIALDKAAYKEFENALQQVEKRVPQENEKENTEVKRWRKLGELAFNVSSGGAMSQPKNALESAALISASRRSGKGLEAIEAVEDFNESPEVKLQVALTLAEEQPVEAVSNALQAVQELPENPLALAALAQLTQDGDDASVALESILAALQTWEDEPHWHSLAAAMYNRQGHLMAEIQHLEKAVSLEPDHIPHYLKLANALLDDNKPDDAIDVLNHLPEGQQPQVEAYKLLIEASRLKKDYKLALTYVDEWAAAYPSRLDPLLAGAEIALESGRQHQAEEYLLAAEMLEPNHPGTLLLQAKVLMSDNRPREALRLLDQAVSRANHPLPLLLERAKLVPMVEGDQAGLNTLLALSKEYPEEPEVLSQLSEAFIQAGQYPEAIKAAQRALKANQGALNSQQQAMLEYQIGVLMRQDGQLDQAIKYLDDAIQRSPDFISAYLEIAEAHKARREHQKGIEYLQQAIEFDPLDPRPYREAGMLFKEVKDYSGAERMLRRAADLAPKDIDIQRKLGAVIALSLVHRPVEVEVSV